MKKREDWHYFRSPFLFFLHGFGVSGSGSRHMKRSFLR